jgi:hypothetical protein
MAFGYFVTGKCFIVGNNTKYAFIYENIKYSDSSKNIINSQTKKLAGKWSEIMNSKEKEKFEHLYKQNR